jgi:hypothetical protein
VTTTAALALGATTMTVSSATGMFVGELLSLDTGAASEVVKVTSINTNTIGLDATYNPTGFAVAHANGVPVTVSGGFGSGIVPTNMANGSTGTILKLYGDINGDGSMVYVEYICDTNAGIFYRNTMPWNAGAKPAVTAAQVLMGNILPNPGGTACFTYQQETVGANTYVIDVAITLTVQTLAKDSFTKLYQTETKALLNVSPRNVFNVWELASQGSSNRVQPMPPSITNLLP